MPKIQKIFSFNNKHSLQFKPSGSNFFFFYMKNKQREYKGTCVIQQGLRHCDSIISKGCTFKHMKTNKI